MNLRKLECFLMVANELHFGKAAEKLYMTQPPLSRAIRELEDELQVKLFTRNSRKVELTKGGYFLRDEAKKLFANAGQIKEQLKQIAQGRSGKLKIGYVGAAMHAVLPAILVALKKELDVNIVLSELKNEEQADALLAGQIDMGFVRSVPEKKNIAATKIFSETFSLILPLNHPLAAKSKTDLATLAAEPFIALSYDCAPKLCDAITDICRKAGFVPKIAHETSQINSIVRLVESGMGYSIVPTSVKNAYAINVKFIELKQLSERALLFLMHKKDMDMLVGNAVQVIKRINK
jgi:DNA-binding transcriptional LysR family regulator